MTKRTEEEVVTLAGIKVTLGGKEYEVAPLVIRDSREWRKKVSAALAELPQYTKVTTDDEELFGKAINAMLVGMPDTVLNLFFSYAKDLKREEIEVTATDAEIAKAFEQVVEIAFPLANSLVTTMGNISR